jgi:hypothetical protein
LFDDKIYLIDKYESDKNSKTQYDRYNKLMQPAYEFVEFEDKKLKFSCLKCKTPVEYNTRQLKAWEDRQHTPDCSFCTIPTPDGFELLNKEDIVNAKIENNPLPAKHLKCTSCDMEYHREKPGNYFRCYCKLANKQGEKTIFKTLGNYCRDKKCTKCQQEIQWKFSREEMLFNSDDENHKIDIKITRMKCCEESDQRVIYLEVDGNSHYHSFQKTRDLYNNEVFLQKRTEHDFLYRIREKYGGAQKVLDAFFNEILDESKKSTELLGRMLYWTNPKLEAMF